MRHRWPKEVYNKFNVASLNDFELDLIDRLYKDVSIQGTCWIRGKDRSIYTQIRVGSKVRQAHRVSYELLTGKILKYQGCHNCDIKACINPDHIFDGTQSDNVRDAISKGRVFSIKIESKAASEEKRKTIHKQQMGDIRVGKILSIEEVKYCSNPLNLVIRLRKLIEGKL